MVMVLLNLAVIPDEVVKEIDFNPGWSVRFSELMKKYKKNWDEEAERENEKDGSKKRFKWKYQDDELEQAYADFMK